MRADRARAAEAEQRQAAEAAVLRTLDALTALRLQNEATVRALGSLRDEFVSEAVLKSRPEFLGPALAQFRRILDVNPALVRLLGYPVEFSEHMPDVGANTFPIAFGDFAATYQIVDHARVRCARRCDDDEQTVTVCRSQHVDGVLQRLTAHPAAFVGGDRDQVGVLQRSCWLGKGHQK